MGDESNKVGSAAGEHLSDDQLAGVSGGRSLHPVNEQRPLKFSGPTLGAKGTDVAMEQLVLSNEELTLEGDPGLIEDAGLRRRRKP